MAVGATEPGDEELAARAASGDDAAFETLVLRYQRRVFRLACRLTSEADAPDVTQETFLSVYRHLPTFRGGAQFSTWLYRIATNAGLMHRRARARRPTESLDAFLPRFDDEGILAQTPDALRSASCVEDALDRRTLALKVQHAIERLPDAYRDAFVLRDLEELSTGDVAEVLGVEAATVRQRVHRARLMVRGYLAELAGGRA
ncbi:MAG: sigma-70 family RNA polymerase sigma factor [Acidobacteria bacterium]|nr:sigma-70 family RNA polymerase sigma factor [Acidobacteriota bacterium]